MPGKIITAKELITQEDIIIPEYQRPYKWTTKNVRQLLSDIYKFRESSPYRLGTIVLHKDKKTEEENIVDGQQRFITLLLIAYALKKVDEDEYKNKFDDADLLDIKFTNKISKYNIKENYLEILRFIQNLTDGKGFINFLFDNCEIVIFSLNNISEAFQFFDSQNARGKDLEPHDLLKAYHLREFLPNHSNMISETVQKWESIKTQDLIYLFSQYLYRIKKWSRGESVQYFNKKDIDLFKGVNIQECSYRHMKKLKIINFFIDYWNSNPERIIDNNKMDFPFSLDETIINGFHFFEMISYYERRLKNYDGFSNTEKVNENINNQKFPELNARAKIIFDTINNYPKRDRIGDIYIRNIFDCLLFYYIEKFDFERLPEAIEKIFIWTYNLRLKNQKIGLKELNRYIFVGENPFKQLKYAIHPSDFINMDISIVKKANFKNAKEVEKLFECLNYIKKEGN